MCCASLGAIFYLVLILFCYIIKCFSNYLEIFVNKSLQVIYNKMTIIKNIDNTIITVMSIAAL